MTPKHAEEEPTTDARHKSADPGEPYANAMPGDWANDTLGRKGYQPPGGAESAMRDQQKTEAELAEPSETPAEPGRSASEAASSSGAARRA